MYYSEQLSSKKDSTNSLWRIVKSLIGAKTTNDVESLYDQGQQITDPKTMSSTFNSYFTSVGPNLASEIHVNHCDYNQFLFEPFGESLFLRPTNSFEIIKIVQSLKSSKSTGYDGISVNLLKKIIHFVAPPLTQIFNLSITSGVCPNSLKIAKIIPIYKKYY